MTRKKVRDITRFYGRSLTTQGISESGTNSAQPTADVWRATIRDDGSIASWEKAPSLPEPLWYHSGGGAGGRISKEFVFDSKVYYLKLYGFHQPDAPSAQVPDFFITAEDPASTDQNLSFNLQTAETRGAFAGFPPYAQARQLSTQKKTPLILYIHSQKGVRGSGVRGSDYPFYEINRLRGVHC